MCTYVRIHTCTYVHIRTYTQKTHARMHKQTPTHMNTQTHKHPPTHTPTHTYTCAQTERERERVCVTHTPPLEPWAFGSHCPSQRSTTHSHPTREVSHGSSPSSPGRRSLCSTRADETAGSAAKVFCKSPEWLGMYVCT